MKLIETLLVLAGLLIAITTTVSGGFILAGILIGGAFTSAAQRTLREGREQVDTQLSEWNARCDERKMR